MAVTPMMAQYLEIKARAEDAIVFFRMGDFFEIFGEDALVTAPLLGLTLTAREKGDQTKIPFCGVPHHSARAYWLKLLHQGFKVAIADQVEDAAEAKGLVKRDIVRIYTPGSIDELEALTDKAPNYLIALFEDPSTREVAFLACELSTGDLRLGLMEGEDAILPLVQKFAPKEIVTRRFYQESLQKLVAPYLLDAKVSFGVLPEKALREGGARHALLERFVLEGRSRAEVFLLNGFFHYLDDLKVSPTQLTRIKPLTQQKTMNWDETARRDLEVFETQRRRTREGSLFHEIDRTYTAMGGRLFYHNLLEPSTDPQWIRHRQDVVKEFLSAPSCLSAVGDKLKKLADIERLFTRVLSRRTSPQELAKIRSALQKAEALASELKEFGHLRCQKEREQLLLAKDVCVRLEKDLLPEPTGLGEGFQVFQEGVDEEFDRLRELASGGEEKLREYEQRLRDETGILSLKIKQHKSYGLLIEVTKTNLKKVPASFVRRQTMVNNERFVTDELIELEDNLQEAAAKASAYESALMEALLDFLAPYQAQIAAVAQAIAFWDVTQGFARLALEKKYTCPQLSEKGEVVLRANRHPVVEGIVGRDQFMPNDIYLGHDKRSLLITGPNMAGKSTVMRQVALSALLHQVGSFVPAAEARLPLFDRIFTRVGASDDLARGQSTFMVEMSEAAVILKEASADSLVILDEVGRGTSSEDGLALAYSILFELAERIGAYCLFATHYHEMIPSVASLRRVGMVQTEAIPGEQIKFTHRLIEGYASSSFGVEVARLAGIPESVLERAQSFIVDSSAREASPVAPKKEEGESLSAREARRLGVMLEKLERVNLNRMTPLQALQWLHEMQSSMDQVDEAPLFSDLVL